MKARTMWIAAIAAPSLLVALRWMARGDDTPPIPSPTLAASSPPASRALSLRDGTAYEVRAELAELRAELARLGAAPRPREELSLDEQHELSARRAAAKAAVLAKAFAADQRDPSWIPQAEHSLRQAFAAAAVPGGRIEELGCGATLCRYTVRFDSTGQRDDGIGAITELAHWDSRGFGGPSPDDPRRYVVYVSRDPGSFPAVE